MFIPTLIVVKIIFSSLTLVVVLALIVGNIKGLAQIEGVMQDILRNGPELVEPARLLPMVKFRLRLLKLCNVFVVLYFTGDLILNEFGEFYLYKV